MGEDCASQLAAQIAAIWTVARPPGLDPAAAQNGWPGPELAHFSALYRRIGRVSLALLVRRRLPSSPTSRPRSARRRPLLATTMSTSGAVPGPQIRHCGLAWWTSSASTSSRCSSAAEPGCSAGWVPAHHATARQAYRGPRHHPSEVPGAAMTARGRWEIMTAELNSGQSPRTQKEA